MSTRDRSIVPVPDRGAAAAGGMLAIRAGNRLVPDAAPDKTTADGYLRLTAYILLQSRQQQFRTIGVVSAREGEGRTTAAVNLAVCLGRTRGRNGRVLLVDADARKRTVTKLFCGERPPLGPDVDPRRPRLIATQFEGVDLMTAPGGADALTLHDPAAWARSFLELSKRYSQIVIDCPPVLDVPEGLVLRECVEQLVLVVRSGETTVSAVEKALGSMRHRVIGVVLNGGSERRSA